MKKAKLFTALALTLILAFSCMIPASAENYSVGTEGSDAEAAITKVLTMPEGTETPTETFTFNITAIGIVEGEGVIAANGTNMPASFTKTIDFIPADAGSGTGTKTVKKQSGNIFDSIVWPHAGLFKYTVTEVAGTTTDLNYSQAEYEVIVYVANGSTPGSLYVAGIAATFEFDDDGEEGDGEKVDPTPGDGLVDGTFSDLVFTNTFAKKGGPGDPTDPEDWILSISKTTTGLFADMTRYFPIEVTLTNPSAITTAQTYKAYVVEQDPAGEPGDLIVVTSASNGAVQPADTYGAFINVTTGTLSTISLKNGQTLVFTEMYFGTTYVANELAAADYKAKVDVVANGVVIAPIENSAKNQACSTASRIIGENGNSAAFTNDHQTTSPTGLTMNDMPFVAMIVAALGALVIFIVVKTRKREKAK